MIKKKEITDIYDAALTVFAQYGYKKATLSDIARELDMTGSNFYRYVKSKKDLYQQAVGHALLQWQAYSIDAMPTDADAKTQFKAMCYNAVEYLSINHTFRKLLVRDPDIFPIFPENDPYEQINRNSIDLIKTVLQKGIDSREFIDIDPETVGGLLWLVYKTFIIQIYVKNHSSAMQDSWKVFIDLITEGLFKK